MSERPKIDSGIRQWLLGVALVTVLAAAQLVVEWMYVRAEPLTATLVEISRQRVSGIEFVRQLRRASEASPAQSPVRLRQAIDNLQRSRNRLAATDLSGTVGRNSLAVIETDKQRALDALDRVLRYSQPGVVGTRLQAVPDALSDELLQAQESLLTTIASAIDRSETQLAALRRSVEVATVLILAFALWLGIRQAQRHASAMMDSHEREQRSLTERNALLLELYNESPIMLYSLDTEARLVSVNDAWLDKMGYEREEVLGRQTREFMTAESVDWINTETDGQALHPDLLTVGVVSNLSVHFSKRSGETLYSSVSARLIRDERGRPAGAHCIVVDVTEHALAIRDLEQTRARLFDIFATLPIPMFHVDSAGHFIRANAATKRLFGVDGIDALNELGHADIFTVAGHRLANGRTPTVHESRQTLIGARGRELEVNLSLRVVTEGDSRFFEGVLVDVTKLESARRSVQDSRERYRLLYETAPVMMCWVDGRGKVASVSSYWLERTGYHADEMLERRFEEFLGPDDAMSRKRVAAAIGSDAVTVRENACLTTKSGETLRGELHGARLRGHTGSISGTVVSFLDRTAELAAQHERDRIASELATAQKLEAIGQLAAGIAHEINTPSQYVSDNLTFIAQALESVWQLIDTACSGSCDPAELQALADGADVGFIREELPAALEQSREGVAQIKKIVQAMKEYAHPGDDEFAPLDLNRALRSVTTIARNEWKYVADVAFDLDERLPELACAGSAVTQVLLNVLVNAAHAIADANSKDGYRDGRIVIRTRATGEDIIVSISDNGIGMDESIRKDVFNPFFTTKAAGRGTGQGLAIAHRIVTQQHGGRIDIDTVPGQGTTFHIVFPRRAKGSSSGAAA